MVKHLVKNLKGRIIQVNKGGPESSVGKLIVVGKDYIAIQTAKNEIIGFKGDHIKGIVEDSKARFNIAMHDDDRHKMKVLPAKYFNQFVASLGGEEVKINLGGPESKKGKLLAVKDDYLLIYNEKDGLVFYTLDHIKSVSKLKTEEDENKKHQNKKDEKDNKHHNDGKKDEKDDKHHNDGKKDNKDNKHHHDHEHDHDDEDDVYDNLMTLYEEVEADKFTDLLKNLKYSWMKVNRKGPESLEGLLVKIDDDEGILYFVEHQNVLRILVDHVKSISIKLPKMEEHKKGHKGKDGKHKKGKGDGIPLSSMRFRSDIKGNKKKSNNYCYRRRY